MAILNYTTTISASKSAAEVSGILAKAKARRISIEYDEQGEPSGLSFVMETGFGPREFEVPARIEGVHRALVADKSVPASKSTPEQARKVAWRILKDWTEAQLALIQAGMTSLDEVMLPYMLDHSSGATFFEAYRDRQLAIEGGPGVSVVGRGSEETK